MGTRVFPVRRALKSMTDRSGEGRERGIHSGTPDAVGVVALTIALEEALAQRKGAHRHTFHLHVQLLTGLSENTRLGVDSADTLLSIIHLSLDT